MQRLRTLIRWYMKQYEYTQWEAITAIKADLVDIVKNG